jgi:hypothetical protein
LSDSEKSILSEGGWDEGAFNDKGGVSQADALHDPATYIIAFVTGGGLVKAGWGIFTGSTVSGAALTAESLWQFPSQAPKTVNGVTFGYHALENMMPKGFGGRGIPPSVVLDVIANGTRTPSKISTTAVVITLENVVVVLNNTTNKIITLYQKTPP